MDVNSRDPLQNIIPFRIKGTEIGRFDSSGNLKIGTTTTTAPTVRLDISGGAARVNSGAATSTALTTTGRIGVNTAAPGADLDVIGSAKIGNVTIGPNPLYAFTQHTFTNANAAGRTGPSLSAVRNAYSGVSWAQNNSYLSMTGDNGIQLWTVPVTGTYTIRAVGASGGNPDTFGRGRDIQTTTTLTKGEVIRILVGQQGVGVGATTRGGGGGTFVVRGTQTPIIVAGGGGGRSESSDNQYVNSNASSSTSGNKGGDGLDTSNGDGGTNGGGGGASTLQFSGGGGGGLLGNGTNSGSAYGGASFINGGVGGEEWQYGKYYGGFGGGGGAAAGGGGGGGYSGGGGGRFANALWATGGGGGSFAISAMTDNGAINTGHGSVNITLLSTSSDFDVSGVARVTASSATSTALTTVGRIGVNTATPTVDLEVNGIAKIGNVTIGANPLYVFTAHTFTNAGATGRTGPTLSTVRTTYTNAGATWATSYLNMTSDNGIQLWTVPVSGTYLIRAVGAGGGGNNFTSNGKGRIIETTTTLIKGEIIRILVGQQGTYSDPYVFSPAYQIGAGGGGTFVVRDTQTPIIVAGGGGGTGYDNRNFVNNNANLGTSGNNSDQAIGGTNGQGGMGSGDGGGGGMFGNGGGNGSEGGLSFINGGLGGIGDPASSINGGFGGGGGGSSSDGGGGGGGYSGGGGGGGGVSSRGGGGGGSFGITTLTDFGAGNTGHGSVTITLLSPSVDLDVSGSAKIGNMTIGGGSIPLYSFTSHTFTHAGATGRLGPTLTNVRTTYINAGATWAATYVNMTSDNGIQLWTVPVSGTYTIRAVGAGVPYSASFTTNGMNQFQMGMDATITTTLLRGEVIRILVGQIPGFNNSQNGGAGGTFVVRGTQTPIIIAGGGGGRGMGKANINSNANSINSGQNASPGGLGGTGGSGGSQAEWGGSGGGFTGNGQPSSVYANVGGFAFIDGGMGGYGSNFQPSAEGGFGGGGGAGPSGGGGGGYSGGGGGTNDASDHSSGGGGGSYSITGGFISATANNNSNGSVTITLTTTTSFDFDVSGVARMSASSATATALTTVGRIGVNTAAPTVELDVVGNATISGSMTISGCKPRIAINLQSSPGLNVTFDIPSALRSGGFIANKVYFAIRVPALSSNPALYLRPNGSATVFHSFTQQFTGSAPIFAGDSPTQGFRICNILNNGAFGGGIYVAPSFINIVGEFTIIRDKVRVNSTTIPSWLTTRLYGTLVQYGNHYIQKWDFQGQAVGGGDYDIFNEIVHFYFTSDTSYNESSVSVKIEGD